MITALFIAAALPSALLVLLGAALCVQILRGRTPAPVPVTSASRRRPANRRRGGATPRLNDSVQQRKDRARHG